MAARSPMTAPHNSDDPFGSYGQPEAGVEPLELTHAIWDTRHDPHELLPFAERLIDATGLADFFGARIAAAKKKAGRPAGDSARSVLIGMFMAKAAGRSPGHAEVGRLLHNTLNDDEQEHL